MLFTWSFKHVLEMNWCRYRSNFLLRILAGVGVKTVSWLVDLELYIQSTFYILLFTRIKTHSHRVVNRNDSLRLYKYTGKQADMCHYPVCCHDNCLTWPVHWPRHHSRGQWGPPSGGECDCPLVSLKAQGTCPTPACNTNNTKLTTIANASSRLM